MSRSIYKVHIADGFADDCDELIHRCSKMDTLTYDTFCDVWKELNFGGIYVGRSVGAEIAELSEEVVHIAKRYMVANTSNFEESVAGLFLVYGLIKLQPYPRFAALRLVPEDVPAVKRLEEVARRDRRLDVLYILGSLLIEGPCQFHAEPREFGMEPALRKYTEGCTGLDSRGIRPKGVFYRQNEELDLIRELKNLTRLYEEAKADVLDENGEPDRNLKYTDLNFSSELDTSLKRLINGIIEDNTDSDPPDRSSTIQEIKKRAMTNAVDPMKHLTTTSDTSTTKRNLKKVVKKEKKASPKKTTKNEPKELEINLSPPKENQSQKLSPSKGNVSKSKGKSRSPKGKLIQSKGKQTSTKQKLSTKRYRNSKKIKEYISSDSEDDDTSVRLDDESDVETNEGFIDSQDDSGDDLNIDEFIRKRCPKPNNTADKQEQDPQTKTNEKEDSEESEHSIDIEIDSVPIVIRSHSTQMIEIEVIDQVKVGANAKQTESNDDEEKNQKTSRSKLKILPDITLEKVSDSGQCSSSFVSPTSEIELANISKMDFHDFKKPLPRYRLKKLERRDLKQPILKSKFKRMGILPVANFEDHNFDGDDIA